MSLTDYLNEYDMTDGGLKELQRRLDAEWTNGYPQAHQMAMISFLDRLGEEDLHGVEWSILHGLESLKGHNEAVLADWKPTYWRKLMLKRIQNSGLDEIAGKQISDYLDGHVKVKP